MLVNYEPFLGLTEICVSTIPIYFSLKRVKRYIQSLINLRTNGINRKMRTVVGITLFQWCVLIGFMQIVYYPTCETTVEKIDGVFDSIQSIFRAAHLLHFYVALNEMVEYLKIVERNLENDKLEKVFDDSKKVLEAYGELGKFYQFFIRFILLEVFYDSMTGVKKLEDFLINHFGLQTEDHDVEAFIVFWWLLHVPLLILVLHEGHLLHKKVFVFSKGKQVKLIVYLVTALYLLNLFKK